MTTKTTLTADEKTLLREAGASSELIEMCGADIDFLLRYDGKQVNRNSTLEESVKYVRGTDAIDPLLTEENVEEFTHIGGHFYGAMWDGNLYKAYSRADANNQALILEVFGLKRVNQYRPAHLPKVTA